MTEEAARRMAEAHLVPVRNERATVAGQLYEMPSYYTWRTTQINFLDLDEVIQYADMLKTVALERMGER